MSDMNEEQGQDNKSPVTAVASEITEPTAKGSAELQALVESLGPGGATRLADAGKKMSELGELLTKAGAAVKANAVGELEDLNRRAKVLAAHAKVSGFDWLSELIPGYQIMINSLLHAARGGKAADVFRHKRAKQEYQVSISGLRDALKILDGALDKMPGEVPEFVQMKAANQWAVNLYRQMLTFYIQLEKNCDIDALLLQGRVREYLDGVRELAGELRRLSDGMLGGPNGNESLGISAQLSTLADTIEERAEAIEEIDRSRDIYLPPRGDKIFVIHGHAEDKWRELRDVLQDKLGLKDRVIVLKEEVSRSETVMQKFEKYAKQCCYGFALITPDDEVTKKDAEYRQARPNVIFEAGWFFGRFGANRLCILKRVGTEIPSDLGGVVTLEFNKDIGEKFLEIKQELQAAGIVTE